MTRWLFVVLLGTAFASRSLADEPEVKFVEGDHRIDIVIGDKPFTSYIYPEALPKPSLYPVQTPSGVIVTRNYPQRPDESDDHPHHVGIFFAADGVNGNSFWLNTSRNPHIEHMGVAKAEGGPGKGTLATAARWVSKDQTVLLEETREMLFKGAADAFTVDSTITLRALDEKVTFVDPKEALFGIRVADWMREDFKPALGVVTISGTGTGRYLNDNGDEGEKDVWARRAKWVRLEAKTEDKTVGIAIFDHPQSVNHPTYWHARSYGLFAANPLGQQVFETARNPGTVKPFHLTLAPGESATFRYRVVVYDGARTKEQLAAEYAEYAK